MNILDHEVILQLFRTNYLLFAGTVFLIAFVLTFYLIPKVLWVTREKDLMKEVNDRSSHNRKIPNFGGVAFFIVLVLMTLLLQSVKTTFTGNHLIIAATLLFMVGLKDDLVVSTARVKLFGQITAAFFLIFTPELQITSLHGFLEIYEIPQLFSYFLSAFAVLAIVNSYNLIDGIDGLASMAGIVITLTFAVVFYITSNPYFVLISLTVAGILAAFLRFNFSREKRKIFMGDSGSLVIGLVIACLTLKALAIPRNTSFEFLNEGRLLFIASILFLPLFDTTRVMLIRLLRGGSPFVADRNHIHHILLDRGYSHKKSCLILSIMNLGIILIFVSLAYNLNAELLPASIIGVFCSVAFLFEMLKKGNPLKERIKKIALNLFTFF